MQHIVWWCSAGPDVWLYRMYCGVGGLRHVLDHQFKVAAAECAGCSGEQVFKP